MTNPSKPGINPGIIARRIRAPGEASQMPVQRKRTSLPGRDPSELVLTYAGEIVKHLGVQMYSGRPVPAIAELISNAWDADAQVVDVRLPLDEAWSPQNESQAIEVSDDGDGMSWETVRDAYLDVGRDRREAEKTDKSRKGRPLQGRKGVGKLAGFGIADVMEVQTVHWKPDPTEKKRVLIWFRLSLSDLRKAKRGPAAVDLIYAGPVSKSPDGARRRKGTTIILRQLHEKHVQNADRFHHSMAQRFLLMGSGFHVRINGRDLREEDITLQWRWPEQGWATEDVPGCGPVRYWVGFTEQPRKQNEGELSGILIYTRGKISQEATFFDISGGVTGQHGLRYMVGMVRVEWLDAGIEAPDLIATHRGSIAWESPQGAALQDWGQRLVRKYLVQWAKLRTELRTKQITVLHPGLKARIEGLAPSYREVAVRFVDQFKSVEMEPEEFESILSWFLDALENATLRSILQKIRETDISDLQELDDLFSKMEVRTAVTLLQIIDSNLDAIETLDEMHRKNARERGVISKHLEKNPWLIDVTWMLSKAEARVATWIKNEFGLEESGRPGDEDRADFFCVAVGGTLHIVEIKRGGYIAKNKDFLQAQKYSSYVQRRFAELTEPTAIKYGHVQSHLIAAGMDSEAQSVMVAFSDKGWVFFSTWDDLIERAKLSHRQFRNILQKRAEAVAPAASDESSSSDQKAEALPRPANRRGQRKRSRKKR